MVIKKASKSGPKAAKGSKKKHAQSSIKDHRWQKQLESVKSAKKQQEVAKDGQKVTKIGPKWPKVAKFDQSCTEDLAKSGPKMARSGLKIVTFGLLWPFHAAFDRFWRF